MTSDENKPKRPDRRATSEVAQPHATSDNEVLRESIQALTRAADRAIDLTKNIPDVAETIRGATRALEAIKTGQISKSIEAATRLHSARAIKLPIIELPQINFPKASDIAAISLPRPATTKQSHMGYYGGGDAIPLNERKASIAVLGPHDIGNLVRKARDDLKLSQQDFADLAGVGRRFVSELENGKQTLELGKVLKVVHAAGLSLFAKPK